MPKRVASGTEGGVVRPPLVIATESVFSAPSTALLLERVSAMVRSTPFVVPANAGSERKPTTSWYGPTVRRSCAYAGLAKVANDDTTTAIAAIALMARDM